MIICPKRICLNAIYSPPQTRDSVNQRQLNIIISTMYIIQRLMDSFFILHNIYFTIGSTLYVAVNEYKKYVLPQSLNKG
jgi:hypothetical protein